jgi:polar amino acid transport system substrate-binding protein
VFSSILTLIVKNTLVYLCSQHWEIKGISLRILLLKLRHILLCGMGMVSSQLLAQDTVLNYNVNGSNSWYPYSIAHSPDAPGIISEFIPSMLALAKIRSNINNFPPKRTNLALETGLLDFDVISPSWFKDGNIGVHFVQSDPIIPIIENIIVLEKNAPQWQVLSRIKNKKIGTVLGYLYQDDADFTRIDFKSERELVMALHKGRIEAAISGDLPALYWAKELDLPVSLAAVHSSGSLVIRLRKEHYKLMPAINSAIKEIKDSGELQKMVNKYTQAKSHSLTQ